MRLLIVEDEIAQAESLQMIFREQGHSCYLAPSTAAAAQMADTHPPDVVVLDLLMNGGVSGLVFLGWLRAQEQYRETPVVITTGLPLDDRSIPDIDDPQVRMLQKPFLVAKLLAAFAEMGAKL